MKITLVTTWVVSQIGLSYTVIIRSSLFQKYTTTDNYGKGTKNSFGMS